MSQLQVRCTVVTIICDLNDNLHALLFLGPMFQFPNDGNIPSHSFHMPSFTAPSASSDQIVKYYGINTYTINTSNATVYGVVWQIDSPSNNENWWIPQVSILSYILFTRG